MRSDLVRLARLERYGGHCATLRLEPLRITVRTLMLETLNLDGLLAYGMKLVTWGPGPFPVSDAPFWLPLPLACVASIDGLPLWHSTCLFPVGDTWQDSTHYHKRTDANPYSFPAIMGTLDRKRPRRQPNTGAGQYMNYRIPEPYTVAESWQATCLGNREEVARLLSYVQGLGKDCAQGYGRVLDWEVVPWDGPWVMEIADGVVLRPIPTDDSTGVLNGWTPPYWRRDLWLPCRVPSLTGLH